MYAQAYQQDPERVYRSVPVRRLLYWHELRATRVARETAITVQARKEQAGHGGSGTGLAYSADDLAALVRPDRGTRD